MNDPVDLPALAARPVGSLCVREHFDRSSPLHNSHYRVLAQTHVTGDEPIGQAVSMQAEHSSRLLVGWPLPDLAAKVDAASFCNRETRFHPLADEIALELGKPRHDGAHQLAAGRTEVEAQAGLRKNAHLPAVKVIERLHEVLCASPPARQLGDEYGFNLARLGKGHHLLALHAVILRAGDRLLEEANDPVPSALGERTK